MTNFDVTLMRGAVAPVFEIRSGSRYYSARTAP